MAAFIRGLEIAMFFMGVYLLITGKTSMGKTSHNKNVRYVVQGWPVRLMGVFFLLPIPLTLLAAAVIGFWASTQGKDLTGLLSSLVQTAIEATMVAVSALAGNIVRLVKRRPFEESPAKSIQE